MIAGSIAFNPGSVAVNPGLGIFIVAFNPGLKMDDCRSWGL
jgi:hypothetical protein